VIANCHIAFTGHAGVAILRNGHFQSVVAERGLGWHLPTQQEGDAQKVKFHSKSGFPNVIGCIDGTRVRILAPTRNEHEYVNWKNFHSINVQVWITADLL
jgi:hypothetical protein